MNTTRLPRRLVTGLLAWAILSVSADEESDLLRILASDAGIPAKAEACKLLRRVGTSRAVPLLASHLGQERLSHAARFALEGLPAPEALAALRQALSTTSGPIQAGIVDSLGWRRDAEAVPLLAPLLTHGDSRIASAAASALGRIRGPEAVAALQAALDRVSAEARPAVADGLLTAATGLAEEGHHTEALTLFRSLLASAESDPVRVAAFLGWFRLAGEDALVLISGALEGNDPAAQAAALVAAGEVRHPDALATFVARVPASAPAVQAGLLEVLRLRADEAALPTVLGAARSPVAAVRWAAARALGALGDARVVPSLAGLLVSTNLPEQEAARDALISLRRGDITAALLAQVRVSPPEAQRELFRVVIARADPAAVPALLALANDSPAQVRERALQAVGQLADARHTADLVRLMMESQDPAARADVRGVLETCIERHGQDGGLDVNPIVNGLREGDRVSRMALLPVAALVVDPAIRAALRSALQDNDESVRTEAARALCATRDFALMPDLQALARRTTDGRVRALALEGCVRLATSEDARPPLPDRVEALAGAMSIAVLPDDKRTVLAGLSQLPHARSLEILESARTDPEIQAEAELACLKIARALASVDRPAAEASLARLAKDALRNSVRTDAEALLQRLRPRWLGLGPYRQEGRQGPDLFDVKFAPELPGADSLPWRPLPGSPDPAHAGVVDLGELANGDHGVVYLRTRVHVPEARAVRFEIGSDDGIKLWLNGELIHANNAVRGLAPGQDRVRSRLRQGPNDLTAKVTQHTAGCGLSLRIVGDDGEDLPGLRWDPAVR